MKDYVDNKLNAAGTKNDTNWMYCPVDKLLQEKAEYDRFNHE